MKVFFRVDASPALGVGHLARCLTLARAIAAVTQGRVFLGSASGLSGLLNESQFAGCELVPLLEEIAGGGATEVEDAAATSKAARACGQLDWVIVDHYALSSAWERLVSTSAKHMMVIDDLADREHACDLLLDQNLHDTPEARYRQLVPDQCRLLLGPKWALLRDEFLGVRQHARCRTGLVERVLVSFGGTDPTNETVKTLEALAAVQDVPAIDVVLGPGFRNKGEIAGIASIDKRIHLHESPSNMAQLMDNADVAIGACGSTAWERCCLGLPAIVTTVADNQVETAEALAAAGTVLYLGRSDQVRQQDIASAMHGLVRDPELVQSLGRAAHRLIDEAGGARGVVGVMEELTHANA